MLATSVIVFREVIEAVLVIGIVLAATQTVAGSRQMVGFGVVVGVSCAVVLAIFADLLSSLFDGTGQDVFNAAAMLLAVGMLAWHNIWMSKHGREMAAEMADVGNAVASGGKPLHVLGMVVAIAVLREGSECVLFLWGIATSGNTTLIEMIEGGILGIAAGIAVGATIYLGLLGIPTRKLFTVTSWMITLLAAGMAAQAVVFLSAAGLIDIADIPLWDSSAFISDDSIVGRILHTLTGYTDRPNAAQLAAWAATVAVIGGATRLVKTTQQAQLKEAPQAQ